MRKPDGFSEFLERHCPGLLRQIEETSPAPPPPAGPPVPILSVAQCYLCGTPVLAGLGAVNLCVTCYTREIGKAVKAAREEEEAERKRTARAGWFAVAATAAMLLVWWLLR